MTPRGAAHLVMSGGMGLMATYGDQRTECFCGNQLTTCDGLMMDQLTTCDGLMMDQLTTCDGLMMDQLTTCEGLMMDQLTT